jgi:hypothetical protein
VQGFCLSIRREFCSFEGSHDLRIDVPPLRYPRRAALVESVLWTPFPWCSLCLARPLARAVTWTVGSGKGQAAYFFSFSVTFNRFEIICTFISRAILSGISRADCNASSSAWRASTVRPFAVKALALI